MITLGMLKTTKTNVNQNHDKQLYKYSICQHIYYSLSWDSAFYIDGLVQDTSNLIANALKFLQSYTKPSMCEYNNTYTINVSAHNAPAITQW